MNSPEEVSKPSRADLYREALDQSTSMAQEILRLRKELTEKSDALISREMRGRELEGRMEWLLHTVERLMLGKPVRDLDEVISAARLALNSKGEKG